MGAGIQQTRVIIQFCTLLFYLNLIIFSQQLSYFLFNILTQDRYVIRNKNRTLDFDRLHTFLLTMVISWIVSKHRRC